MDQPEFCKEILRRAVESDQVGVVCYLLWWLWSNRNTVYHEQRCLTPQNLVNLATRYSDDFVSICQKPIKLGPHEEIGWKKPKDGCVKINVDASFVYKSGESKSGAVIRNSLGTVLTAAISKFDSALSPLHAELNAIVDGLILAEAQGFEVVEIESDCLVGIQEIQKEASECLWLSVINNIKYLASSFISCRFKFVSREFNGLAHNLAHWILVTTTSEFGLMSSRMELLIRMYPSFFVIC